MPTTPTELVWIDPKDMLPQPGERVIIYLQGFDSNNLRPQFATWNAHNKVFQNSGNTKFKPEFINWWMPASALPPAPGKPESVYAKSLKYSFEGPSL